MRNTWHITGWLSVSILALAMINCSAAPVQWAAQGGNGTWDTKNMQWNELKPETAFTAGQDVVFGGQAGTVSLGEDITVGSLAFTTPGYTLAPMDKTLTINKGITGSAYTVRFDTRKGAVRFPNGGEFNGTIRGTGLTNVLIDGGTLNFGGTWQIADAGLSSSFIRMSNGAKTLFTATAQINNQLPSIIEARVIFVSGTTGEEVVEFDPAFRSDYMGFPDLQQWGPNGFSVLFLEDVTYVSHNTASLPTVHKRSGNGNHTHHGVVDFYKGTKNTWLVKSATQYYDGVVGAGKALTIRTEKDLILTGAYFEDSRCYFGADSDNPVQLVKDGPATLALMCSQVYSPGTTFLVKQGAVDFYSDPADPGQFFRVANPMAKRGGQFLQLQLLQGATATCNTRTGCGLAALTTDGTVDIALGVLKVKGDLTSKEHANWRFNTLNKPVAVEGTLTAGGTLDLTNLTPPPGTYQIFSAKQYNGDFTLKLPAGMRGAIRMERL